MPQADKVTYFSQNLWNYLSSFFFYTLIILFLFLALSLLIIKKKINLETITNFKFINSFNKVSLIIKKNLLFKDYKIA